MLRARPPDEVLLLATDETIRLTEYSHGAGCGCKIAPSVLSRMLASDVDRPVDPRLLVGNETRDDAAVYALDDENVVISTTDFFMPIVDDPRDFGAIAAVNAMSDVYAMGGSPIMAIAILGWPVGKLDATVAQQVLEGAREACAGVGISIAGGHSIDAPEPIFGLAVTGTARREHVKTNAGAAVGCELYLTKPLGVGILTTALKRGLLRDEDLHVARQLMLTPNDLGARFGALSGVRAMTDVTGFGLLGHLIELCEASGVSANVHYDKVPLLDSLSTYVAAGAVPGGTTRNHESYGSRVTPLTDEQRAILCDPQTSGGLLVAVDPADRDGFLLAAQALNLGGQPLGNLTEPTDHVVTVT